MTVVRIHRSLGLHFLHHIFLNFFIVFKYILIVVNIKSYCTSTVCKRKSVTENVLYSIVLCTQLIWRGAEKPAYDNIEYNDDSFLKSAKPQLYLYFFTVAPTIHILIILYVCVCVYICIKCINVLFKSLLI